MSVPTFIKHIDTSDQVVEFSADDDVYILDIRCAPSGFDVIYSLNSCGVHRDDMPEGHTLLGDEPIPIDSKRRTRRRKVT